MFTNAANAANTRSICTILRNITNGYSPIWGMSQSFPRTHGKYLRYSRIFCVPCLLVLTGIQGRKFVQIQRRYVPCKGVPKIEKNIGSSISSSSQFQFQFSFSPTPLRVIRSCVSYITRSESLASYFQLPNNYSTHPPPLFPSIKTAAS